MRNIEKIILGTVQLGLTYGINNHSGKPDESEAFKILDVAQENGINVLDTAEAYGNAMEIIGKYHSVSDFRFKVISKFKYSPGIDLLQKVRDSLAILKVDRLHAYLLHDADKLNEPEIASQFEQLKYEKSIEYSGVSIYTNEQFQEAIQAEYINLIQIPFNLLDNNYQRGELINKAKAAGKIIHVRSVFLQGLFFMDTDMLPAKLLPLSKYIHQVNQLSKEYQLSKEALALNYVLSNANIDGVLTGVDSSVQLSNNIVSIVDNFRGVVKDRIDNIHVSEIELLNPANWN